MDVENGEVVRRDFAVSPDSYQNTVIFVHILELLSSLASHRGLVSYVGYRLEFPPQLFSEYIGGSTLAFLFEKVSAGKIIPEWNATHKSFVIFGLACALMHLHSHGISHRYLKPSRIFLTPNYEPKITDYLFGESSVSLNGEDDSLTAAPECFTGDQVAEPADIFAWGIIVRQIVTGHVWSDGAVDTGLPTFIGSLVRHSMAVDPARRPTACQIVYAIRHSVELLPGVDRDQFDSFAEDWLRETIKTPDDELLLATAPQPPDDTPSICHTLRSARSLAEAGDLNAMVSLGTAYLRGTGCTIDLTEAALWFQRAADRGHQSAAIRFARLLLGGAPPNPALAKRYLESAASQNSSQAMFELARVYKDEGNGLKSREFYQKAAARGHREATFKCAELCESDGLFAEALEYYRKAGYEFGIVAGLVDYARMLIGGVGCPADRPKGVRALELAVQRGDKIAQYNYGTLLSDGRGVVPQDLQEAAMYFRLAADQGFAKACTRYADALIKGRGVIKNQQAAVPYLRRAIDGGDAVGMCTMAGLLLAQPEREGSWAEGFALYERAARVGQKAVQAMAQFRMGECAERGVGIARDVERARRCYQAALALGVGRAQEALTRLSAN
jgi:TPR repeat protein